MYLLKELVLLQHRNCKLEANPCTVSQFITDHYTYTCMYSLKPKGNLPLQTHVLFVLWK